MKSLPRDTTDTPLHPVAAVLLILAVCLLLWAVAAVVFVATLVVAGSVGLFVLLVGLGAIWRGLS